MEAVLFFMFLVAFVRSQFEETTLQHYSLPLKLLIITTFIKKHPHSFLRPSYLHLHCSLNHVHLLVCLKLVNSLLTLQ